jgi:hypothetical protein
VFLSLQLIPKMDISKCVPEFTVKNDVARTEMENRETMLGCRPVFAVFWKGTPSLCIVPATIFVSQGTTESCLWTFVSDLQS